MNNKGKSLERLVRLIQEAFKDKQETKIFANRKIKNNSGAKREFDIVIQSSINNINILIAIECKDFKRPVSVSQIEAFHGKCQRIPEINRKIFVSQSGYQSDAINAAKDFGISLYNINDIESNDVKHWIPVYQLGVRFQIMGKKLFLDIEEERLKELDFNEVVLIHFFDNQNKPKPIDELIHDVLMAKKNEIWAIRLYEFMKESEVPSERRKVNIPFTINLKGTYLVTKDNEKIALTGLKSSIDTYLISKSPDILNAKAYESLEGKREADYINFSFGENQKTEIITTDKSQKYFYTDETGTTKMLQTLGVYDPKTDTYKSLK